MANDYYYGYESDVAAVGGAVVGIVFVIYVLLYLVLIAYSVVAYIFQSRGFYAVAKRRGFDKPWLAWIPYANLWLLGKIADDYCLKVEKQKTNYGKKIIGSWIGFGATAILFVISIVMIAVATGVSVGLGESGALPVGTVFFVVVPVYLLLIAASVVATVFQYIALYKYFKSCQPSRAVLYLLLSIFVGVVQPFFIYAIKDSDEGIPEDAAGQIVFFQDPDYDSDDNIEVEE